MRSVVAVLVALGMLAGCGLGEAGMPLPQQEAGVAYPGDRQELAGVLDVSDFGCFNLALDDEHFLVIWPPGSGYADQDDEYALRLPSGEVIANGEGVVGTGAFTPTAPLLAERDSAMAYAIRGCAPDASEVVVFDTATSPSASASPTTTVQPPTPSPSPTHTSLPPPGYVSIEGLPISVLANEAADALFGEVETCVSDAGYTVSFPASWYTNPATRDAPACSWFAPEPFDVSIRPAAVNPPPPDGVWIAMGVVDGGVGYTSITPTYMTEDVSIGGYDGHRAEFGPSTLEEIQSRPEYRAYHYVIPFEEFGPTFAAGTDVDLADDYLLSRAVLDRIMATISFDR